MNTLKKAFGVAAMTVGGGGFLYGGSGLLLGGWSTAGQAGGMDFTAIGVGLTVVSAGLLYAGYKSLKSAFATATNDDNFEQAIQDVVDAEVAHSADDPVEGEIVRDDNTPQP